MDAYQHIKANVLQGTQEIALKQQVLQSWQAGQVMQLSDVV